MSGKRSKAAPAEDRVLNLGRANEKQAQFFESRTLYTAYGGARGGGKSWAVRVKAVGGAIKWPGIRILIVRRTYPELDQNHIEPVRRMVPPELGTYNATSRTMRFENGSIIKFGHFGGTGAENEYQGQEYDWIFMDEATQFTEQEFRTLGGCLRGVNDIPKRFYLTCNPGGIGHRWVKRLFIDRDFRCGSADSEQNENPEDYSFVFATVEDNKALMKSSPAYVHMLSSLPEKLRRAHRYGDWDALSGSYFSEFSAAKHVCDAFVIPEEWPKYRSFDYGLDMFACCWIAVDPSGRSFVYREFCAPGLIVHEAAKNLLDNTGRDENIIATFAPPDMWSRQKDTGKSMAEVFLTNGVPIVKAGNSRVQGHLQIKEMLADMEDGRPGLMVFSSCKRLIACLQAIQADEDNPNDCAKQPHDITHSVDALRYYCIMRRSEDMPTPKKIPEDDFEEGEDYDGNMTGGSAGMSYLGY